MKAPLITNGCKRLQEIKQGDEEHQTWLKDKLEEIRKSNNL